MSVLSDLPLMLGNALGLTGGLAQSTGGFILSIGALIAVGMVLAMSKKAGEIMSAIVLTGMIGMFTVFGWLDYWVLLVAALVIVWMASSTIARRIPGG